MALRRLSGQTIGPGDGGSTVASMGDMGAGSGMLIVETIAKIRRAYFAQKKLEGSDDGDRQMVKVLSAVLTDRLAPWRQPVPKPSPTASIRPMSSSTFSRGTATPDRRRQSRPLTRCARTRRDQCDCINAVKPVAPMACR
jgi:hypothetical protein